MAKTEGERYREIHDFLKLSFDPEGFTFFLRTNDLVDVIWDVNPNAAANTYFDDVIEALNRRGQIDGKFFDRLAKERPAQAEKIEDLAESWTAVNRGALAASGHDVIYRSIVRRYPSLRDHAIDFGDVLTMAERFVGRDELFRRLAEFAGRPCGYFRVVAEAGLGKTALAAAAAKRLNAPVFFANASRGLTRPDQCLNHLAVELIARFGLDHDHLPARAGEDSAFLGKVLAEAAAKAQGPLWIVVDALDEADPPGPGRNPLLLPDRLPHGVYVLLTHRPGPGRARHGRRHGQRGIPHRRLRRRPAGRHRGLSPPGGRPARDPPGAGGGESSHLDRPVRRVPEGARARGTSSISTTSWPTSRRAQPGFDPLDLEALPGGLRGYYQQFWGQMEQVRRPGALG